MSFWIVVACLSIAFTHFVPTRLLCYVAVCRYFLFWEIGSALRYGSFVLALWEAVRKFALAFAGKKSMVARNMFRSFKKDSCQFVFRNVLWCLLWGLSSFSIGNVLQGTLSTAFELGLGVDTAAKGTWNVRGCTLLFHNMSGIISIGTCFTTAWIALLKRTYYGIKVAKLIEGQPTVGSTDIQLLPLCFLYVIHNLALHPRTLS